MKKILIAAMLVLAALAAVAACKVASGPDEVAGAASDHSHVVSFEQFKRIVLGAGQPSENLAQAYADTSDVCTKVMTSRWQDRSLLLSVVPASIQDPIVRSQVYVAVLGTGQEGRLSACVA